MSRIRKLSGQELLSYQHCPASLASQVRLIQLPIKLGNFKAITLGRYVLLASNPPVCGDSLLIAHELAHVKQWSELGIVGFMASYLGDFVKGLRREKSWMTAYRSIGLESEARQCATEWQKSCQTDVI